MAAQAPQRATQTSGARLLRWYDDHFHFYRCQPAEALAWLAPRLAEPSQVAIRRATLAEAAQWPNYYDSWQTRDEICRSLERGHQLFIAEAEGRAVGFRWLRVGEAIIPGMDLEITLPPHVGMCSGGFVDPQHRLQGVSTRIYLHLLQWMVEQGLTTMATSSRSGHAPSLRTFERLGFTPYADVEFRRRLFWRLVWVGLADGRVIQTRQFGRRAAPELQRALFG